MSQQGSACPVGVAPTVRAKEIVSNLEGCQHVERLTFSVANIEDIADAVERVTRGAVTVKSRALEVWPNGAPTLVLILSASSITFHFWPEYGLVDMNIYICQGYEDGADNSPHAEALHDHYVHYFGATHVEKYYVPRGPRACAA